MKKPSPNRVLVSQPDLVRKTANTDTKTTHNGAAPNEVLVIAAFCCKTLIPDHSAPTKQHDLIAPTKNVASVPREFIFDSNSRSYKKMNIKIFRKG